MKLTHRDFRPLRRSKYVAQPLKRRPTLRILVLAALGIAVYLKYDSVVHSKAFQTLRQPRKLMDAMLLREPAPSNTLQAEGLTWSADSIQVEAECREAVAANCLNRWKSGLGPETIGALRGTLAKASMQLEVEASKGLKARFLRAAPATDPFERQSPAFELVRLEIRGEKEVLALERPAGNTTAPLCDKKKCLDANPPRMPFKRYRLTTETDPADAENPRASGTSAAFVLSLVPLDGPKVFPILRGRVVDAPSTMAIDQWVKVYHGGSVFSYYRGLSSLSPEIKSGALFDSGAILGEMAAEGDSVGVLHLRIEKGGIPVEPLEFLGITHEAVATAPETETLHVR